MPDSREHLPHPGVSKTGSSDASSVEEVVPVIRRRQRDLQDVAQNAIDAGAREIMPPSPVTPGVKRAQQSILEVQLNIGSTEFGVCKFTSADGETYRLRYAVAQGGRSKEQVPA